MEPLEKAVFKTPEVRLKSLKNSLGGSTEGFFTLVTFENVIELLLEHKGHEDVRINTYAKSDDIEGLVLNIDDILALIVEGREVYQYVIRYTPHWIRKRRQSGTFDIPHGWIKASDVARIKGAQPRTVDEHCRKGNLTCQRLAEGDYYVEANIILDYWIKDVPDYGTLYQRLLLIQEVLESDADPETPYEMFDLAAELEKQQNVKLRGSKSRITFSNFVTECLGSVLPNSIVDWENKIRALVIMSRIKRNEVYGIEDSV